MFSSMRAVMPKAARTPVLASRAAMVTRRPISMALTQRARRTQQRTQKPSTQVQFFSSEVATKDEETSIPAQYLATGADFRFTATALTAGVIMSQELYIVNDETMLAGAWLTLMYGFVKGAGASVAEQLDTRAAEIEDELNAARELQKDAVKEMITKADSSIDINNDLLEVCDVATFNEWTAFKMEKTLQKATNNSATQTIEKLRKVQFIEEAYARRKLTAFVEEVQSAVEASIEGDAAFRKSSIDEAILGIKAAA